MTIVQINATCESGSTGKICTSISTLLDKRGVENYILYSLSTSNNTKGIKYTNSFITKSNALEGQLLGLNGFNDRLSTMKLIRILDELHPDLIHLHNIHSNAINLNMLFKYIKNNSIKVVWTFHDCWAITGYCTYFDYINCEKWRDKCFDCPQKNKYSWFFDNSSLLLEKKKAAYGNYNFTVVSPSKWLANIVGQSFLRNHPIRVINNGIDLSIFRYENSDWKIKKNIKERYLVLGVAFGWTKRKGIDTFKYLSNNLGENYKIVLVGTDDVIDQELPNSIIKIHRTNNQKELAEIYSAADVFVNPTLEENFPTVNMEAIACGTPVVSFDTGGSSETFDSSSGILVEKGSDTKMLNGIRAICENNIISRECCRNTAKKFDMWKQFEEYIKLYEEIIN